MNNKFPSITDSLERSAKDLRQGFQSLPSIKLGGQQPQQQPVQQPPQQVRQPLPQNYPPRKDDSIETARRWVFWILLILVGGIFGALLLFKLFWIIKDKIA